MCPYPRPSTIVLPALLASLLVSAPAVAQSTTTVDLVPVADTTLFQESTNHASATGGSAFTGNNAGGYARRALLRFDLTAIPSGATVVSASLAISVDKAPPGVQSATGRLHRLLTSWGTGASNSGSNGGGAIATAGDATWSHRFWGTPQLWRAPGGGGDFIPGASDTIAMTLLGRSTWSGDGVRADVQTWVDQPAQNFGWIIRGEETLDKTAHRFASAEFGTPADRPRLRIEYRPGSPGATDNNVPLPAWATAALGLALITALGRRSARRTSNRTSGPTVRDQK